MPASRYSCPECEAIIRRAEPVPDGKKIRCPECDVVFRPPVDDEPPMPASKKRKAYREDDDDDRPRKKSKGKKQKQSNNAALIAIPILALVLLGIGSAVAYFGFIKKDDDPNKNNPVVLKNQENPRSPGPNNNAGPQGNPNAVAKGGNGTPGVQIGNTARDISGEDIDGQPFKLSDYRGKVVLLDFWGDW